MARVAAAVAVLALASACLAAPAADEVLHLPGWEGALPSKHYSGYVPVAEESAFLHYWFIESERNPSSDPVVLWLNGGPGSSSLIGLLTENGQLQLNDDSIVNGSKVPKLLYNKYSWSQVANMLYLEMPKGVGFSYCKDQSNCKNTDESTAKDAGDAILAFFKKFPEFANNDFYITGESYAGTYIPMLMDQLDQRGGTKLKGAAIGDGCWGNEIGTCGFASQSWEISAKFYAGHAMISQVLYADILKTCNFNVTKLTKDCEDLLREMDGKVGDFDIYNIYDDCGADQMQIRKLLAKREVVTKSEADSYVAHPQLGGALNDYPCGGETVMEEWLRLPEVAKALHVLTGTGGMQYTRTVADLRPLYKRLAQKYRLLIYSGDVDACVPFVGSEKWTRELGFPVKDAWRPWLAPSVDKPKEAHLKAGYVTTYDTGSGNFTFLTVNGAGHMVPTYRPPQALAMVTRFLANSPY
eukprot:m.480013 g.480013  ORF g.480013 m.480013 type:complete len:468 (-) comp21667_c0_seq1:66-1469(-)